MRRGNNNRTREMSRRNESRIRELGSDPGKVAFLRKKTLTATADKVCYLRCSWTKAELRKRWEVCEVLED